MLNPDSVPVAGALVRLLTRPLCCLRYVLCTALLMHEAAAFAVAASSEDAGNELKVVVELDADAEVVSNVRAWLAIRDLAKSKRIADRSRGRIVHAHGAAEQQIRSAMQPFGYYRPVVEAQLDEIAPGSWRAEYRIERGPRTRLQTVLFDPGELPAELANTLRSDMEQALPVGTKLIHSRYETVKAAVLSRLLAAGYLDAVFERAELRVDPAANSAAIDWQLKPGPRFRFGPVSVDQQVLRESFVKRYLTVQPGAVFNTNQLIETQLRLNNSNYFKSVSLDIQRDAAIGNEVPVIYRAEPRKRRRYTAGLGYGTDTGPRASAGLENRRVNSRGHKYRFNSRVSQIASSLQAEYDIPIKNVASDRYRFSAIAERADVGDADATNFALGVAREDSWGVLRRRLFLNLERANFEFGDEPSQSSTLLYPGFSLSWDRLDNPKFVRRGISLSATLLGGAEELLSTTSFVSVQTSARVIRPLASRGRLLLSLQADYLEASEFDRLPPSQRFFLGGDRSVRGYGFQSISPENAAGDDIGGSRSIAGSVEVDYQLTGSWGLAAFFDAGAVATGALDDLQKAFGAGVRYRSPVGMIRLDLAHPLDDASKTIRAHLSIGPDL